MINQGKCSPLRIVWKSAMGFPKARETDFEGWNIKPGIERRESPRPREGIYGSVQTENRDGVRAASKSSSYSVSTRQML